MIELRFRHVSSHACSGALLHDWTVPDLDLRASLTTDAPLRVGSSDVGRLTTAASEVNENPCPGEPVCL